MHDRRASSTTLVYLWFALFIRNGIILIWGGSSETTMCPVSLLTGTSWVKGASRNQMVVHFTTVLAILALHYLLQNTKNW